MRSVPDTEIARRWHWLTGVNGYRGTSVRPVAHIARVSRIGGVRKSLGSETSAGSVTSAVSSSLPHAPDNETQTKRSHPQTRDTLGPFTGVKCLTLSQPLEGFEQRGTQWTITRIGRVRLTVTQCALIGGVKETTAALHPIGSLSRSQDGPVITQAV